MPVHRLSEIYPFNYYSFRPDGASALVALKSWFDRRALRRVLSRLAGERLHVLDVGGGTGWQLTQARQADPRVAFTQIVDIDPGAAAAARAAGHEFFVGRVEEFSPENKFDLVLLYNVVEHVADPAAVLAKVADLPTPGGVALVQTPNYDSLDARVFRHRNWAGYHCPRHFALFTRASFTALCERKGLRVRTVSFLQGASFWAVSTLIVLHRRGWVRAAGDRPILEHWGFAPLALGFALLDGARSIVAKTSQMSFVLERADSHNQK